MHIPKRADRFKHVRVRFKVLSNEYLFLLVTVASEDAGEGEGEGGGVVMGCQGDDFHKTCLANQLLAGLRMGVLIFHIGLRKWS